jgi:hypothetical protein
MKINMASTLFFAHYYLKIVCLLFSRCQKCVAGYKSSYKCTAMIYFEIIKEINFGFHKIKRFAALVQKWISSYNRVPFL